MKIKKNRTNPINPLRRVLLWLNRFIRDSLLINSGYILGAYVLVALAGVAFWAMAARFYQTEDVGLGTAILSVSQLLAGLSGLGIGMGLMRFLVSSKDPAKMLNAAVVLMLVTGILVSGVYLMSVNFWSPSLALLKSHAGIAITFVLLVVSQNLSTLFQMVFSAYRQSKLAFWQVVISNVGRIVMVAVLVAMGMMGIVFATISGSIIAVIMSLLFLLPVVLIGYKFKFQWSSELPGLIISYSFGSFIADLLYRAPLLLTPIMALEILGPTSSAHAYIGWMLGWTLSSPGQAVSTAAFAEGANSPQDFNKIILRAINYGLAVSVILSCLAGIFSSWILLLFGKGYSSSSLGLFRWLILATPFMTVNILYFSILRVTNQIGRLTLFSLLSATISLIVTYVEISDIGIASAGLGWFLAQLFISILIARPLWKLIRIHSAFDGFQVS